MPRPLNEIGILFAKKVTEDAKPIVLIFSKVNKLLPDNSVIAIIAKIKMINDITNIF